MITNLIERFIERFLVNLVFSNPTLIAILIGLAITVIAGRALIRWLVDRQKRAKWWSSLDRPWKAIFKTAIRIKREPTAKELVAILNLTQLDCHEKKLTHLAPLRALTSLQSLNCSENQLTSLEPLRTCTDLQNLDCHQNKLTSLGPLRVCTGLQSLNCNENQLTSLEPLRALTGLQDLKCWGNQLTSLEPLHGLKKSLKKFERRRNLSLSQPELECFLTNNRQCWYFLLDQQWQAIFKAAIGIKTEPTEKELVTIVSLTQLKCNLRGLTSLEPLRALTGLQNLECAANQLTSLEPLRALTDLQTLNCLCNQLTSLEPLQACSGLRVLHCGWNYLTSLEPLQACPDLQTLNCRSNELTNLEPLHGLKSLKQFGCRSNPSLSQPEIERFRKDGPNCRTVLNSLDGVLTLPPQVGIIFRQMEIKREPWWSSLDEQWRAIFTAARGSPCAALHLAKLDCHSKNLTDLEPLRACPGLQAVNCRDNQLTSLEPLYGFKNLRKLDCRDNPSLSEANIERFQKAVPSCQVNS